MKELANEIEKVNEEYQEDTLSELAALSAVLIKVLKESAKRETVTIVNESGNQSSVNRSTIQMQKLSRLMRDIDGLERDYSDTLYRRLIDGMAKAVSETVAFLQDKYDMPKKATIDVDETLGKGVIKGDKTLEQRTKVMGTDISSDVRKVVRRGVMNGDDVGDIIGNVLDVFNEADWKIVRIIESEIYDAYRYQYAETSKANSFDWIRIHESFPRHPRRKRHRCYTLANKDKYGKGTGVYKSTDVEIFHPHPQCTSWLEVVEVDIDADR